MTTPVGGRLFEATERRCAIADLAALAEEIDAVRVALGGGVRVRSRDRCSCQVLEETAIASWMTRHSFGYSSCMVFDSLGPVRSRRLDGETGVLWWPSRPLSGWVVR